MYAVKCPDGTWLDPRRSRYYAKNKKMRLYSTAAHARLSLGRVSSPLVKAPERPVGQWTPLDREKARDYQKFLETFNRNLSTEEYWKLREAQGYELLEVKIQVL
jgi:hypothetical protein